MTEPSDETFRDKVSPNLVEDFDFRYSMRISECWCCWRRVGRLAKVLLGCGEERFAIALVRLDFVTTKHFSGFN